MIKLGQNVLIRINKTPSRRDLDWFGVLFAGFFGLLGLLAWRKSGLGASTEVLWSVAVAVPLVYYAIPAIRRPLFVLFMYLAFPIGFVISHLVLVLVYFLVFTPIGLVMRLLRFDPLQRHFDRGRETYWIERSSGEETSRYFRQY